MKVFPKRSGFGLVLMLLAVMLPVAAAGGPEKVAVCHNGKTISVGLAALSAHLAHGDFEGDCDNEPPQLE